MVCSTVDSYLQGDSHDLREVRYCRGLRKRRLRQDGVSRRDEAVVSPASLFQPVFPRCQPREGGAT